MPDRVPEVFLSDIHAAAWTSSELAAGRIRKIGPRLYTRNLRDSVERIVSRHVWDIVAVDAGCGIVGVGAVGGVDDWLKKWSPESY